ncbi:MAG: hypothetical protein QMB96_08950, partial [Acinetobacter towneri]
MTERRFEKGNPRILSNFPYRAGQSTYFIVAYPFGYLISNMSLADDRLLIAKIKSRAQKMHS